MSARATYLGIAGAFAFARSCAWTLNLVYQIERVGLGPLQLVIVGTVLEAVCLLAQVPTGLIADLVSRRLSVIVGFALLGGGVLLEGLVPTFAAVLAGTVLVGIGFTCVDGALEAWAADEIGEERVGEAFTRGGQVAQAATVVGIAAAVGLASLRLNLPLVVGGVAFLILATVLRLMMAEHGFTPARDESTSWRAMADQVRSARRAVRGHRVLLSLLAATAFLALGSEGFDRLGQDHIIGDLGFPTATTPVIWLGILSAAAMLGSIGLTELLRRRADVASPVTVGRALTVLHGGRTVAVLAFALAGHFYLGAAAWLVSELLREAAQPLMSTWIVAQTDSATRATVISALGMVDATGQIVGGPPVGLIGDRFSLRAALVASGLVTAPAVAFLALAARRARADQPRAMATASVP